MMKEIAWNMFKNTGNIDIFLKLKQIESIENKKVEANEYCKNEGNNNSGK